ncbi:MAG: 4-hydroxy-3-methylbut-2-enyl diphosphate reductase [Proteobacteria bacterium]|nr:4-hydroxy-3-methylbut-2-enyl diphosphate reductase [Pseudomonadota bacterium]
MAKPSLKIIIANPRGFCAGVQRAIEIVEVALEKFGRPVYVRHEIVHNRFVVEGLEAKGAVFVDDLDEVPENIPVVFSAHGVPKSIPAEAERRNMFYVDATCPLVNKVHREAERHHKMGRHIIMIGHQGHPEVIGTLGQLPEGSITLVESAIDVASLDFDENQPLAFITQTTLSVDDTSEIVTALKQKFPQVSGPKKEDICYATTNRQEAVKAIARRCDRMLVIGAPNSSNSLRLVEVSERNGCPGRLLQRATEVDWEWLEGAETVGITAGASAPEVLVEELLEALRDRYDITMEYVTTSEENVKFKLPLSLLKEAG